MQQLGRLLLAGYALAAAAGIVVHQAGLGLLPAIAVFWVGGALIVGILAVIVTPWLAVRPATTDAAEDAALAEALRLWEEDRLGDRAAGMEPARHGADRATG